MQMGNFMRARTMSILFSEVDLVSKTEVNRLWPTVQPPGFINKVLLGHRHAHSSMSAAAFSLQWQN